MVKNEDLLLGFNVDDESSEWLEEFVTLKNDKDYEGFMNHLKTAEKIYLAQHEISKFIHEFTKNTYSYEQKLEFMNYLKKSSKLL